MSSTHSTPGHDGKPQSWSDIVATIRSLLDAAEDLIRRDGKAYRPIPVSGPVDWDAYVSAMQARDAAEADGTAHWGHVNDVIRALGHRPGEVGRG